MGRKNDYIIYGTHIYYIYLITVGGGCSLSAEIGDCIVGGSSTATYQLLQTTDRVVCQIQN